MTTINDLLAESDEATLQAKFLAEMLDAHKANGVPVDAWQSTLNTGFSQTQSNALLFANQRQAITEAARSMYLNSAAGDGLTLLGRSEFSLERLPAQSVKGIVRLISSATAPLYNFVPGQITIGTQGDIASQKTYTNITGGTLAPNNFLDLSFESTGTGASYNIPNSTPMDMKTSFVGVFVSNPIYPPAFSWITQIGTDQEDDARLKLRCNDRWGTIGAECNSEGIQYWGLEPPVGYVSSPVKFIRTLSNWIVTPTYTGYWPGLVTVVVGNDLGGLTPADLAAVKTNFENPQKYGIGRTIFVINMVPINLPVSANVFAYRSAGLTTAQILDLVSESLVKYQSFINIGDDVFPQKIGARIEDADKKVIRNVQVVSPIVVTEPLFYQRVILTPGVINVVLV